MKRPRRRRCVVLLAAGLCLAPLGSCGLLIDEFIQLDHAGPMLAEAAAPTATVDHP